jgi:hypothetical protein
MGSGVGRSCGNERKIGVIVIPCTMVPSSVVARMDTKRWPSKMSMYRIEERLLRRTCVVGPAVAPGPGTIRYNVDELQLHTGDEPRVCRNSASITASHASDCASETPSILFMLVSTLNESEIDASDVEKEALVSNGAGGRVSIGGEMYVNSYIIRVPG